MLILIFLIHLHEVHLLPWEKKHEDFDICVEQKHEDLPLLVIKGILFKSYIYTKVNLPRTQIVQKSSVQNQQNISIWKYFVEVLKYKKQREMLLCAVLGTFSASLPPIPADTITSIFSNDVSRLNEILQGDIHLRRIKRRYCVKFITYPSYSYSLTPLRIKLPKDLVPDIHNNYPLQKWIGTPFKSYTPNKVNFSLCIQIKNTSLEKCFSSFSNQELLYRKCV
jgi:hypothetical protein